jgi:hypothetical protein
MLEFYSTRCCGSLLWSFEHVAFGKLVDVMHYQLTYACKVEMVMETKTNTSTNVPTLIMDRRKYYST